MVNWAGRTVARDPIRPGFRGTVADLWVLKSSVAVSRKISVREAKYTGLFEVIKIRNFQQSLRTF